MPAARSRPIVAVIVNLTDRRARFTLILAGSASLLTSACAGGAAAPALRIGAIFPLSGSAEAGATEEFAGARLAADMLNDCALDDSR